MDGRSFGEGIQFAFYLVGCLGCLAGVGLSLLAAALAFAIVRG